MKVKLINKNCDCEFWTEEDNKQIFNVYGIYFNNGEIEFLMKFEEYGYTPVLIPMKCFEIVETSFYSSWVPFIYKNQFSIICKEWTKYPEHLNFFVDSSEFETGDILFDLDSFHYWVKLMDAEFK
jgi:hypothetical protein